MPPVYDELRRLARGYMRNERNQPSLQPTALLHEAYIRLTVHLQMSWETRTQFFGLAARLMRNILVDHARSRPADKRGGGAMQISISAVDEMDHVAPGSEVELLALDEALNRLAQTSPQHSRIVELRFFGGLSIPETAEPLGLSHATVERKWSFARTWLRNELI